MSEKPIIQPNRINVLRFFSLLLGSVNLLVLVGCPSSSPVRRKSQYRPRYLPLPQPQALPEPMPLPKFKSQLEKLAYDIHRIPYVKFKITLMIHNLGSSVKKRSIFDQTTKGALKSAIKLAKMRTAQSKSILIKATKAKDYRIRAVGFQALGYCRPVTKSTLNLVALGLKDTETSVQLYAVKALGHMQKKAIPKIFELIKLRGPDYNNQYGVHWGEVKWETAESIKRMGTEAIYHLVRYLNHSDPNIRQTVAEILRKIKITKKKSVVRVVQALTKNLLDKDWFVRVASIEALGFFGHYASKSVPILIKNLFHKKCDKVYPRSLQSFHHCHFIVMHSLVRIEKPTKLITQTILSFIYQKKGDEENAIYYLKKLIEKNKKVIKIIKTFRKGNDAFMRKSASYAMSKMNQQQ